MQKLAVLNGGYLKQLKKIKLNNSLFKEKKKTFGEKNVKLIMLKIVFYLKKKKQILKSLIMKIYQFQTQNQI